jgi:hypothetical protein
MEASKSANVSPEFNGALFAPNGVVVVPVDVVAMIVKYCG